KASVFSMANLGLGNRRAHHPRRYSWVRAVTPRTTAARTANGPAHQHQPAEIGRGHRWFAVVFHRGAIPPFPNFRHRRRNISHTKFIGGHRLFQRLRHFARRFLSPDEYRSRDFSRWPALERACARRFASALG